MHPLIKDYLNTQINRWPTRFAKDTYKKSELVVLDQLLNTIGNGIRNNDELLEVIANTESYKYCKFINKSVYVSLNHYDAYVHCLKHETVNYPEIKEWLEMKPMDTGFNPYPNFQEKYSTIYTCPIFLELGDDWLLKAIWFYEECYKWFIKNEASYPYAFPQNNLYASKRYLTSMEQNFIKFTNYNAITRAYNVEYMGDTYDFMIRRWCKEKIRIYKFIKNTIRLLKKHLKENGKDSR